MILINSRNTNVLREQIIIAFFYFLFNGDLPKDVIYVMFAAKQQAGANNCELNMMNSQ